MKLTPDDLAYLKQAAARDKYNPDDALKVFNYESSGNPGIWGGKGGGYFGLFQAGAPERKQFGIDTENPNAKNQIDAFGKFLAARGYKPGMGLLDMYSTVNAGSPGHFNASDGNGTVASHVAKMTGSPMQLSGAAPAGPLAAAGFDFGPSYGGGETQASAAPSEEPLGLKSVQNIVAGLLNPEEENPVIGRSQIAQHLQFAGHMPGRNTRGLLGR